MGKKQVYAVIGASYGDEGKGLVTDFMCRYLDCKNVVRFNGGAQAGHTVRTTAGRQHVFHHLGSGTLAGAATWLSDHFICNPILYATERTVLISGFGILPVVTAHSNCAVTTPYDMLLNQLAEDMRPNRHGSCGVGIYETVLRTTDHNPLRVKDLFGPKVVLEDKLVEIRTQYVPERVSDIAAFLELTSTQLAKSEVFQTFRTHLNSRGIYNQFMECVNLFKGTVRVPGNFYGALDEQSGAVIFEGAQGLALDQNVKNGMPHLTPSNTGLQNVWEIGDYLTDVESFNATYVTRTYLTRHGAGPLPREGEPLGFELPKDADSTNIRHQFQGDLRIAPLDPLALRRRIHEDLKHTGGVEIDVGLAVTCVDQSGDVVDPSALADKVGVPLVLYSQGPTADNVTTL